MAAKARSEMPVVSDKPVQRREVLAFGVVASGAVLVGKQVLERPSSMRSGAATRPAVAAQLADPLGPGAEDVPLDASVSAYLGDLVGQAVGTCVVVSVGALERGGIPVTLRTATGLAFRVDVLRLDPADGFAGVGVTSDVAVYLRNGGDGTKATEEERGLGAMALAHEIGRRDRQPPHALRTMGERAVLDSIVA